MAESSHEVTRITPSEVEACRKGGEQIAILDVRRREAWSTDPARIPGAIWLPLDEVPRRARELPADAHLVVYCS
ncbi:MAG: hypothetical protein HYT86_08390 [candidate division NC10 bacterium]|nr:hypothetical protein [candidate division NC10 bacterium]